MKIHTGIKFICIRISIIVLGLCILLPPITADAIVSVRGYYHSDGTYVRTHVRSNPNGLKYDNYSWNHLRDYITRPMALVVLNGIPQHGLQTQIIMRVRDYTKVSLWETMAALR